MLKKNSSSARQVQNMSHKIDFISLCDVKSRGAPANNISIYSFFIYITQRLQQAVGGIGLQYECMSTWNINSSIMFDCLLSWMKFILLLLLADLALVENGLLDMATVPQRVKV